MKKVYSILIILLFFAIPSFSEEFTLGMVQRSIYQGMPQCEVIKCIGAPNIITKNSEGCEIWVYDKTSKSTKEVYNKRWFWLILTGRRKGCKNTVTSENTITITLDFDENSCLKSYAYKSTDF